MFLITAYMYIKNVCKDIKKYRISQGEKNLYYGAVLINTSSYATYFISSDYLMMITEFIGKMCQSIFIFSLMRECVGEQRTLRLILWLSLSIVTRSNGLTNIGFVVYFLMRDILLGAGPKCSVFFKMCIVLLTSFLPLSFFYHYAFKLYCQQDVEQTQYSSYIVDYAQARNYILAGPRQPGNSPWCDATFPNPYGYIQSFYWNVGFLRYYEWKQLPNFLLAMPAICFLLRRCTTYLQYIGFGLPADQNILQRIKEHKSLPFILHALFLTIFCTIFVHVQVTTRLLCAATPCIYWFASEYFDKPLDQIRLHSKPGMILSWFASYAFFGTILFCNNLPWT